ncbi:helix-hairpin-helix domain-containing protein [Belliella sp. DSM 107340]|uniref:Helix-hairpin-helix domain-containing protein n=1 Tax=Belliella calami TaxID=2923436 RepID=A0ABS9URV4_9BACT|nr:helix-hairpin-helix domain-containing protein [Belliella calami]MCH7398993.1 helix-hairpin-helix domain-containing protein [Belliella calami]
MVSKIKFFLKNTFGFTNRESRGFVLLLPVLAVLYAVPVVHSRIIEKRKGLEYETYLKKMDSLEIAGWSRLNVSYINQDSSKSKPSYQKRNQPKLNKILFDEADSIVLQIVPGIGSATAGRIVKFRDAIGGMHHKDQLLDVYGLTPEVLERVFEYFEFQPGIKTKININTADVGTLAKHPYINYGSAKVIVAYREQHGDYQQSEDLLKVRIFSQEWIDRVKPYLEF